MTELCALGIEIGLSACGHGLAVVDSSQMSAPNTNAVISREWFDAEKLPVDAG